MTATDLVGAVNIRILARLAPSLCLAVEQDGRSGLGVAEEVDGLDDAAHDELDPEDPSQC